MDIYGFSVANRPESPIRRMDDPIGHFKQGNRFYQQDDYSQAIEEYDRCIQSEPDAWEPYMARGNAKAEIQLCSDAPKDYDSALDRRGSLYYSDKASINIIQVTNEWKIFYNQGNMKAVLRDYPGAIEDYGKAIGHPSADRDLFGPISFNRANAKVRLRCFDDAINDYDDAISHGSKEAHFNKANALVFLGRFREAFQCYGHKSLWGGQYSSQAAHNQDSVKKILDNIDKSEFEVDVDSNKSEEQLRLVVVVVDDTSNDRRQLDFRFKGNIGNMANVGLHHFHIPSGKGFSDDPGFSVELIGTKTD